MGNKHLERAGNCYVARGGVNAVVVSCEDDYSGVGKVECEVFFYWHLCIISSWLSIMNVV